MLYYVSFSQGDWDRYLPRLELAYNNHVQDAKNYSPFFLEYGQHHFSISDILLPDTISDSVSAQKFLNDIRNAREGAKIAIAKANQQKFDRPPNANVEEFEVGDQVMPSKKTSKLILTDPTNYFLNSSVRCSC